MLRLSERLVSVCSAWALLSRRATPHLVKRSERICFYFSAAESRRAKYAYKYGFSNNTKLRGRDLDVCSSFCLFAASLSLPSFVQPARWPSAGSKLMVYSWKLVFHMFLTLNHIFLRSERAVCFTLNWVFLCRQAEDSNNIKLWWCANKIDCVSL